MQVAEDAPEVVLFDEPALAAAQQWMHDLLAKAAKAPPNDVFKLFKREMTQSIDGFDKLDDEAVHSIVANTPFQIALLACIAELVSFAASGRACFPALTARANAMGCIFDMWEALLYVQHHLLKMGMVALPDSIEGYLGYMRIRIAEEVAWMTGSPLYTIMTEGGGGTFRPGDTSLLQDFILAVSRLGMSRAQQAALSLLDRMEELAIIPTFVQRVNQAVARASPHHGMEVFQADDESIGEETEEPVHNVRKLYNDVFLPRMRPFLQQKDPPPEEPRKKGATTKLSRLPLRSLSAKDINSRPQPDKKRLNLMR
ncbi:g6215 [Coccomyxa elongata]